jgi:hypothetical protein
MDEIIGRDLFAGFDTTHGPFICNAKATERRSEADRQLAAARNIGDDQLIEVEWARTRFDRPRVDVFYCHGGLVLSYPNSEQERLTLSLLVVGTSRSFGGA